MAFDNAAAIYTPLDDTCTVPITVGSNANRILYGYLLSGGGTGADTISSVKFNGVDMDFVAKVQGNGSSVSEWNYVYQLINPPSGTHDLVFVTGELKATLLGAALSYDDALQTSQPDVSDVESTTGTSLNKSVTTDVDGCTLVTFGRISQYTLSAGAGTVVRGAYGTVASGDSGAPVAAGVNSCELIASTVDFYAQITLAFKPAAGGEPTSVTLSGSTGGTTGVPSGMITATLDAAATVTTGDVSVTLADSGPGGVTYDVNPIVIPVGETAGSAVPTADTDGTHEITETNDASLSDNGAVEYTTNNLTGSGASRARIVNLGG